MFMYVTERSFRVVSASAPLGPCFSWLSPLLSEVAGFLASGPARPVTADTGWRGAGSLWGPSGLGTGDQKAERGLRPSRGHFQLGFPAPVRSGGPGISSLRFVSSALLHLIFLRSSFRPPHIVMAATRPHPHSRPYHPQAQLPLLLPKLVLRTGLSKPVPLMVGEQLMLPWDGKAFWGYCPSASKPVPVQSVTQALCSETGLPLPRGAVITRQWDVVRGAQALALAVPISTFWMWGVEEPQVLCEVKWLSRVRLFVTPWTVAYQAPLSMEFSRQEYWSGLPFPSLGNLPDPGIKPGFPTLQADALPFEPPGKVPCSRFWEQTWDGVWPQGRS